MSDQKTLEVELVEGLNITLRSIEFDNEYEGDESAPHRTYFLLRLHAGESWQNFSVTVNAPYQDFADLHQQA